MRVIVGSILPGSLQQLKRQFCQGWRPGYGRTGRIFVGLHIEVLGFDLFVVCMNRSTLEARCAFACQISENTWSRMQDIRCIDRIRYKQVHAVLEEKATTLV